MDDRKTKPADERGIECPRCGCRHFYVVYTRPRTGKIVRRKECRHCGHRIVTFEKLAGSDGVSQRLS